MSEPIEIVTSFPLPPKVYYENLTEEEIILMEPPQFPSLENLTVFGSDQNLLIKDKEVLSLTDEIIKELKSKKVEIFDNFKKLLDGIETIQDPSKLNEIISSIDDPFQKIFEITSKLAIIQAAISLEENINTDFRQINAFLKNENEN